MQSPFFIRTSQKTIAVHVRIEPLLFLYASLTSLMLFSVVLSSCIETFDCTEFLPTISYLASYSFYDRFIVFILTCSILPLLLFFTATFMIYSSYLSRLDSVALLIISVILAIMVPSVAIIDEVTTSAYIPLERIHAIVLAALVGVLSVWMAFSLEWLYKIYKDEKDKKIKYIAGYVGLCFVSLIDSYWQWKISDTTDTYVKLALKEYLTIMLLLFLPRVYCFALKGVNISLDRIKFISND